MGMPRRYVQGPGTIDQLGSVLAGFGREAVIVADQFIWESFGQRIEASLSAADVSGRHLPFEGECTDAAISAIARAARDANVVLAAGGGKAIDTAKGVATELGIEVVVFPTIASNDSPTSRLIVVYSEDHVLERARRMNQNPAAVIVDTEVIVGAPRRFLLAGIGDAVSKIHEVGQSSRAGAANFFDGSPTLTALAISECCDRVIREDSRPALNAHARGTPDAAFERLVEATILMSGLAFENGGLSVAHAVLRGFSTLPALARSLHGEQVAVGLLIQLMTNPETHGTARELIAFFKGIGLPTTLEDLGADAPAETLAGPISDHTFDTAPYVTNLAVPLDRDGLAKAIIAADRLARDHDTSEE
jgi:glycerol dehydrogenase